MYVQLLVLFTCIDVTHRILFCSTGSVINKVMHCKVTMYK